MGRAILRLASLCIILMAGVSYAAPDESVEQSINAFLQSQFSQKKSCMVIGLVDEHGSRIFRGGKLDNGTEAKPDGDTVFFIGSVSKTFTALLLQDMADRGEVKLDDPAAKYLPVAVKMPTHGGRQITLLDLATHASGLPVDPGNMTGGDTKEKYETYTVEMLYDYLANCALDRDPGLEFGYSNVGMALLGHVLSLKAGTDLESLLIERICKPLQMDSTRLAPTPEMNARLAIGHETSGQQSLPWKLKAYAPAGGIHSTANDLLKYAAAHAGITSPPIAATMTRTHVIRHVDTRGLPGAEGNGGFGQTAMDWMDRGALQPPGMQLLGHAGGAGSYHAWVGFDTKQHRGVVVLSTDNDVSVEAVGWTLLQGKALTAVNAHQFDHQMVGIGVALGPNRQGKGVDITQVFPKSPAAEAGLASGDTIRKVDDQSIDGRNPAECASLLRGSVGTRLKLEVVSAAGATTTVELTRRVFNVAQ